jgi:hypothetical protein
MKERCEMEQELYLKKTTFDGLQVSLSTGVHVTIAAERFDEAEVRGEFILWYAGASEFYPHPGPKFQAMEGTTVKLEVHPLSFTVKRLKPERVLIDLNVTEGTKVHGPVMRECIMVPGSQLMISQKICLKVGDLMRNNAEIVLEQYNFQNRGKVDGRMLGLRCGVPQVSQHKLVPGQELLLDAEKGSYLVVHHVTPEQFTFFLKTEEKTKLF